MECPKCNSGAVVETRTGERAAAVVGGIAGGVAGWLEVSAGAEAGAAVGAVAGPVGVVAGAILGALSGAAVGLVLGARLGRLVDAHVLSSYTCANCGHGFDAHGLRAADTVKSMV